MISLLALTTASALDALGGYRPLEPLARLLGSGVFLGMLALAALLERLQFQLRYTESSTWWASNGRDVVNAFALAAMALGLRVIGFTGPIALCIAATLVLLLSALQSAVEKHRHAFLWSLAAALLLGAPVMVAPELVHGGFRAAVEWLFQPAPR